MLEPVAGILLQVLELSKVGVVDKDQQIPFSVIASPSLEITTKAADALVGPDSEGSVTLTSFLFPFPSGIESSF